MTFLIKFMQGTVDNYKKYLVLGVFLVVFTGMVHISTLQIKNDFLDEIDNGTIVLEEGQSLEDIVFADDVAVEDFDGFTNDADLLFTAQEINFRYDLLVWMWPVTLVVVAIGGTGYGFKDYDFRKLKKSA